MFSERFRELEKKLMDNEVTPQEFVAGIDRYHMEKQDTKGYELRTCHKEGWCADCHDASCAHAGDIGADCPKWVCDNDVPQDCRNCSWMRDFKEGIV